MRGDKGMKDWLSENMHELNMKGVKVGSALDYSSIVGNLGREGRGRNWYGCVILPDIFSTFFLSSSLPSFFLSGTCLQD